MRDDVMSGAPGRVLVTGGGGLLGTAIRRILPSRGIACTALDVQFRSEQTAPGERLVVGSCTDEALVADALDGCDAVIHLAALPHPDAGSPREVFGTNVVATFTVLSLAGEKGVTRVAIASSINATGIPFNRHGILPAYFPIDEELPSALDDWYSLSKADDERAAAMAASRWGMSVVCLRLPLTATSDTLSMRAAKAAEDPRQQVGEGWSYLVVEDGAEAFLAALQPLPPGAPVVLVAAPETLMPWPTEDLLAIYAPGIELRRPIPGYSTTIDTTRATRLLGFSAQRTVEVPGRTRSGAPGLPIGEVR